MKKSDRAIEYVDRREDPNEYKEVSILEDILCKIISLCNHVDNNNCSLNENTQELRDILIRAVGVAETYETGGIPMNNSSNDAKEPTYLTFRMRKALDVLSDMLDRNYALVSSQNRTINEFKQLV